MSSRANHSKLPEETINYPPNHFTIWGISGTAYIKLLFQDELIKVLFATLDHNAGLKLLCGVALADVRNLNIVHGDAALLNVSPCIGFGLAESGPDEDSHDVHCTVCQLAFAYYG